jgi:hypothetical protein
MLAYLPHRESMATLVPEGDHGWRALAVPVERLRLCENYTAHDVCNWVAPADDSKPLCISCQLTGVIPDLSRVGAKQAWYRLEAAKRRLVYSLLTLKLPLVSREADAERGLEFKSRSSESEVAQARRGRSVRAAGQATRRSDSAGLQAMAGQRLWSVMSG